MIVVQRREAGGWWVLRERDYTAAGNEFNLAAIEGSVHIPQLPRELEEVVALLGLVQDYIEDIGYVLRESNFARTPLESPVHNIHTDNWDYLTNNQQEKHNDTASDTNPAGTASTVPHHGA